jgi:hypothetical protein
MDRQLSEIKNLAFKHSKQELGRMVQMGMIDPQKAMLAGMMRDRISKEDTKPPVTTVAEDILAPQPEVPPQMGMPPEAPPAAPEQMMAAGGLSSIPVHNIGNFAGGGIIAFDDGGEVEQPNGGYNDNYDASYASFNDPVGQGVEGFADGGVPRYNGNPSDGSQVMYDNAKVTDSGGYRFPSGSLFGMFERRQSSGADAMDELQKLDAQIANAPPGPMRDRLIQTRQFVATRAAAANTQSFAPPQPTGVAALNTNAVNTSAVAPTTFPAPVADPAAVAAAAAANARPPGAPKMPAPPPLPPIGETKLGAAEGYKMPELEDIKGALGKQAEADRLAGVDTSIYDKLSSEFEGKKGKLGERKKEAVGMALMQAGIGLFGAKQGQEFSALSESGQKALAGLAASNEKIREYEDKLEDKQRDLALAKNDYARTKSKSAQDRVQRIEDKRSDLENRTVDAKNKRDETIATLQLNERGQNITARGQDLSYRAHMAQISAMFRPSEIERAQATYNELYQKDPAAAARWLETRAVVAGAGKPQNTFSFEEAMKIVAAKPTNINATPEQLAQQARALMSAGMQPGGGMGAPGARPTGARFLGFE